MAVKNDMVPPTINHFTDDPQFDSRLNFTFNKAQQRTVNAALSNTFGFGGHNVSVIFRKYTGLSLIPALVLRKLIDYGQLLTATDKQYLRELTNMLGFMPGNVELYRQAFRHNSVARFIRERG